MKYISFTREELEKNAITAMENCMAYLTMGKTKLAAINYGAAETWSEMLSDLGVYLEESNEHYADMLDIWAMDGQI